jgi:hypothetical protein
MAAEETRAELREVVAQLEALNQRRDDLIRQGLDEDARVVDLVADTGLTRARIYQIRDRRR